MHISAIYFLDSKGKVIIFRHYRGDDLTQSLERFQSYFLENEGAEIKPVMLVDGVSYMHIKYDDIYILAVSNLDANAAMVFQFLYDFLDILKNYLKEVEEESLRDNFVVIYELLDEVLDFGYPQHTDLSLLKNYVTQKGYQLAKGGILNFANDVGLKEENISYSKNSVYLDVIERVNMLVSSSGVVMSSEIHGNISLVSFLVGNPELRMRFNDRIRFDLYSNELASGDGRTQDTYGIGDVDYKFNQCVKVCKGINSCITFTPPEGIFDLMTYRISTPIRPLIWLEAMTEYYSHSRVKYLIKVYMDLKTKCGISKICIEVPVPSDADSPKFRVPIGSVEYQPGRNVIVWNIPKIVKGMEYMMNAQFGLSSIDCEDVNKKRPIDVKFEVPFYTVSGIQVKCLDVAEKGKYNAMSWVRYLTMSGNYQFRF